MGSEKSTRNANSDDDDFEELQREIRKDYEYYSNDDQDSDVSEGFIDYYKDRNYKSYIGTSRLQDILKLLKEENVHVLSSEDRLYLLRRIRDNITRLLDNEVSHQLNGIPQE